MTNKSKYAFYRVGKPPIDEQRLRLKIAKTDPKTHKWVQKRGSDPENVPNGEGAMVYFQWKA